MWLDGHIVRWFFVGLARQEVTDEVELEVYKQNMYNISTGYIPDVDTTQAPDVAIPHATPEHQTHKPPPSSQ